MVISRSLTIEEICDKLRPIFDKKIDEIYFLYSVAPSREEKEEIAGILSALYQKNVRRLLDRGVILEPPSQDIIDGTYNIGTITYAREKLHPFRLREEDWPRHVCITGMSGSGKTTLAVKIVEELIKHKKNFLVFDWKKSFRPLLKADSSVLIFTVGDESLTNLFKININQPPEGVSPKEWISFLVDLITESFFASFGVHKVLIETLDEAFNEWGVYQGSENYPTWHHIKWRLENKSKEAIGREAGWVESALRIATILTFGDFGKTLNYKEKDAYKVEELLNKKVIMELNSLGNVEKKFFCEFILSYIYKLKKAKKYSPKTTFDYAIIVDEAHNIFLKKPTTFINESITDLVYREMREYGTSLICIDQHISKISDTVKGNSACHIAFQQQLPEDIEDISRLMLLKEKKHYFSMLPVGKAIVKLSERYTSPFLIEIPFPPIKNLNVTDNEIKLRFVSFQRDKNIDKDSPESLENPKSEKSEKEKKELTPVQNAILEFINKYLNKGIPAEKIRKLLEDSKDKGEYTTEDILISLNCALKERDDSLRIEADLESPELSFLNFLRENPDHKLSTVEIYKKLKLSARKGNDIKNSLLKKRLIKIEEVKYEKGWKKFIRLNQAT